MRLVGCSVCFKPVNIKHAPIVDGKRVCADCKRDMKKGGHK
jgi:hypothetical protein